MESTTRKLPAASRCGAPFKAAMRHPPQAERCDVTGSSWTAAAGSSTNKTVTLTGTSAGAVNSTIDIVNNFANTNSQTLTITGGVYQFDTSNASPPPIPGNFSAVFTGTKAPPRRVHASAEVVHQVTVIETRSTGRACRGGHRGGGRAFRCTRSRGHRCPRLSLEEPGQPGPERDAMPFQPGAATSPVAGERVALQPAGRRGARARSAFAFAGESRARRSRGTSRVATARAKKAPWTIA